MAGFRQTLRKLAKKYGVDIKGATYTQVVQAIVKDNVARASKKMGDLSNRRMKTAFEEGIKDGIIELPEYAVPLVTMRKAAEDGKMITDTLRDTLTRGLRKSIVDNPNNTEKAIEQMQQSIKDIMTTYTTSHAKMVAVTEVRSSVDLSKYEYVRELLTRNPNRLRVVKRWIHHDHLVKVPRPTHKAIDGEQVLFNQPFSIGLMYPHDPNAPASEVIGCQCGYRIEIEEMATNEIFKALKMNIARLGEIRKEYPPHHISHRKDGDYEKQEDGEWEKVKKSQNRISKTGIVNDINKTAEELDPEVATDFRNYWNKVAKAYGADTVDEMSEEQFSKMSSDVNSCIMNFIKSNDLVIHNNAYSFATAGKDVFEDGHIRSGYDKDHAGDYLEKRNVVESSITRLADVNPIYAEVNTDWKGDKLDRFYNDHNRGFCFRLKDSLRDKCTYSLGDTYSMKIGNFVDKPLSDYPRSSLGVAIFTAIDDNGKIVVDKEALKENYIEAQIWQDVTKDDIDVVFVPKSNYQLNKKWFDRNFDGMNMEIYDD